MTLDGETHRLPERFMVVATQNPIENQGVYPLPEAQLDRFLFKLLVPYPAEAEEARIVATYGQRSGPQRPADLGVTAVTNAAGIGAASSALAQVTVADEITGYVVRLIRATRDHAELTVGASPRAAVLLAGAARARAALEGRDFVIPDDVKALARAGAAPPPDAVARCRDRRARHGGAGRRTGRKHRGTPLGHGRHPPPFQHDLRPAGAADDHRADRARGLGDRRTCAGRAGDRGDCSGGMGGSARAGRNSAGTGGGRRTAGGTQCRVGTSTPLPTPKSASLSCSPSPRGFGGGRRRAVTAALACDPRLAPGGRVTFDLAPEANAPGWRGETAVTPGRRGTAPVNRVWLRWEGPLGLGARQVTYPLEREVRIWPDLSPVRSKDLQTFLRNAQTGLIARRIRGEGTQFEALSEYEAGMDRRRIDWKASARHNHLYARENESERKQPDRVRIRLRGRRCASRWTGCRASTALCPPR